MPKIPRTEATVAFDAPKMPHISAEAYAAPGRAMQQLGSAIGSLGAAFQDEVNQQNEFDDKLKVLQFQNSWEQNQNVDMANFNRENPDGYATERYGAYRQEQAKLIPQLKSAKMQRWATLHLEQHGSNVYERYQKFEYGKRGDMIYGNTSAAITGEFSKPTLNNPDTIVDDVQGSLSGVDAIIKSAPISEERKRALQSEAASLAWKRIESVYTEAGREDQLDLAAKRLMQRLPVQANPISPQAPAIQPRTSGWIPKHVIFHDYGGTPKNSDGMHNPYNALVFPDGSVRYRNPSDPYGVKAPHAFKMNNSSVGIAYAGPVGSKPTPEALATLQKEYDTVRQLYPGISHLGHGEAYQKTKGTDQQASRDGRDLIEASWRSAIKTDMAAQAPQQAAGPVPVGQRGLTQYAGLTPPARPGGAHEITPKLTAYAPQGGGSLKAMEGGYAASRPGPDGKAEVRTLEDFASGKSKYITIAGDPSQYGKSYTIPRIEWIDSKGNRQVSENVKAVVHDTGSAFKGAGEGKFDIPVAKDLSNAQMNAQPFLKGGVALIPDGGTAPAQTGPDKQKVVLAGLDAKQKAAKLEELVGQGYQSVTHQVDKDGNDVLIAHRSDKPAWYINARGKGDGKSELDRPEFAGPEWAGESIKKIRAGEVRPMNTIGGEQRAPGNQVADSSGKIVPMQAGTQSQLMEHLIRIGPQLEKRASLAKERWAKSIEGQLKQVMDLAEKGYGKDSDLDTIEKVIAQKPDVAAQFGLDSGIQGVRAFVEEARSLRLMKPQELQGVIQSVERMLQSTDADPAVRSAAVQRLGRMTKLLGEMRKGVNEDPLTWADRTGIQAVEPIDWQNPESLTKRADQARTVAQYFGQAPQFFTAAERDALKDQLKLGGKPMLGMLGAMHQAFGPDMIYAMGEISKQAPVAANVGWMLGAGHGMKTIEDAARGMEILAKRSAGDKIAAMPKMDDMRQKFFDTVGATTTSRISGDSRDGMIETTNAIYIARAMDHGWVDPKPDEWGKILLEHIGQSTDAQGNTFGGLAEMGGGHKAFVPMNVKNEGGLIRSSTFRQLLDSIRQEDLIDAFGSMPMTEKNTPLSMSKLRNGKLVTIGDGRYFVATGDLANDDPQFIKDGTGRNYILDLKALEPKLRQRRPDLYKGYEDLGYTPADTTMPFKFQSNILEAEAAIREVGKVGPKGYRAGPVESDMIIDRRAEGEDGMYNGYRLRMGKPVPKAEDAPPEFQNIIPRMVEPGGTAP